MTGRGAILGAILAYQLGNDKYYNIIWDKRESCRRTTLLQMVEKVRNPRKSVAFNRRLLHFVPGLTPAGGHA